MGVEGHVGDGIKNELNRGIELARVDVGDEGPWD